VALVYGSRLGPYEIVAPLGAGGMGEVYKARDTRLDRTVAIKIPARVPRRRSAVPSALRPRGPHDFPARGAKLLDFGLAKTGAPVIGWSGPVDAADHAADHTAGVDSRDVAR
jgi:hypothetical protein